MDQQIIDLFDEYTHKPLSRDEFIRKLAMFTGSVTAALSLLPLLEVNYANAQTVAPRDSRIVTDYISYPGDNCTMKGYLAKPAGKGKFGSVVVVHENRGLNPHTEDVARRIAAAGYLALAPDALSPQGGTPANTDEARALFGKIDASQNLQNFIKSVEYLKSREDSNRKSACIGFCWGGAMANQLAVHVSELNLAIPFYGRQPDASDVPRIKALIQLHYGGLDERVNAGIPAYEEALKKAGTKYELYVYEGAQHAFFNDTAPTRYNAAAAKLAWDRMMMAFKNIA